MFEAESKLDRNPMDVLSTLLTLGHTIHDGWQVALVGVSPANAELLGRLGLSTLSAVVQATFGGVHSVLPPEVRAELAEEVIGLIQPRRPPVAFVRALIAPLEPALQRLATYRYVHATRLSAAAEAAQMTEAAANKALAALEVRWQAQVGDEAQRLARPLIVALDRDGGLGLPGVYAAGFESLPAALLVLRLAGVDVEYAEVEGERPPAKPRPPAQPPAAQKPAAQKPPAQPPAAQKPAAQKLAARGRPVSVEPESDLPPVLPRTAVASTVPRPPAPQRPPMRPPGPTDEDVRVALLRILAEAEYPLAAAHLGETLSERLGVALRLSDLQWRVNQLRLVWWVEPDLLVRGADLPLPERTLMRWAAEAIALCPSGLTTAAELRGLVNAPEALTLALFAGGVCRIPGVRMGASGEFDLALPHARQRTEGPVSPELWAACDEVEAILQASPEPLAWSTIAKQLTPLRPPIQPGNLPGPLVQPMQPSLAIQDGAAVRVVGNRYLHPDRLGISSVQATALLAALMAALNPNADPVDIEPLVTALLERRPDLCPSPGILAPVDAVAALLGTRPNITVELNTRQAFLT